jgi:hypothetical protein
MPTYPTPRYIHSGRSIHDPSIQLKDWWDGTYDEPVVFVYNDQTVAYRYRDSEGRLWEEWWRPDGTYNRNTSDSGDPYDTDAWRRAEPREVEEPSGRSHIAQQDSRPLEETTPLFGPGDQTPDPPDDPTRLPGHWDPVSLRWVPDEPTSSVGKVLDDDAPWYTSYKPRAPQGEPTPWGGRRPMRRLATLRRSPTIRRILRSPAGAAALVEASIRAAPSTRPAGFGSARRSGNRRKSLLLR